MCVSRRVLHLNAKSHRVDLCCRTDAAKRARDEHARHGLHPVPWRALFACKATVTFQWLSRPILT